MRPLLPPAVNASLLAFKHERDGLVLRSYDTDQHGPVRGEGVVFERSRAGLRGRHLQDIVIPPGLGLEIADTNRGVVLAAGAVVVEEHLLGAFIDETAGDDDD